MAISKEQAYYQLGALIAEMPDLGKLGNDGKLTNENRLWLGRCHALLEATGQTHEAMDFRVQTTQLVGLSAYQAHEQIGFVLHRALARLELAAPAAAQGAFIPVGAAHDAIAATSKVFQRAQKSVMIVDPYMDANALSDFAGLAAEGISIHLLTDEAGMKPAFPAAVARWKSQHGSKRPVDARVAGRRTLHDRAIIVDEAGVWSLTQSLNAFAERSPASILRVDPETAQLKVAYYVDLWRNATAV